MSPDRPTLIVVSTQNRAQSLQRKMDQQYKNCYRVIPVNEPLGSFAGRRFGAILVSVAQFENELRFADPSPAVNAKIEKFRNWLWSLQSRLLDDAQDQLHELY